jgi:hypothetical protein
MSRSENGFLVLLRAIFAIFAILAWVTIGGGLASSLERAMGVRPIVFWIPYLVVSWIIASVAKKLIAAIRERHQQRQEANRSCTHGIKGGETRRRCPTCVQALIAREKEYELEHARRQKLAELGSAATALRTEEHARLTKARLHKLAFLTSLSPAQFEDAIASCIGS